MANKGQAYWDERYLQDWPREPSPFLTGLVDVLAPLERSGPARALDVGGGSGRNALWLAGRGWAVTVADISPVALALARQHAAAAGLTLDLRPLDLERQPLPAGPWDLIVNFYFLQRPLLPRYHACLRPGGLLVFAHATRSNLTRHPRPSSDHVLEDGELPGLARAAGFEIQTSAEGWFEAGRHEARLVARRPA